MLYGQKGAGRLALQARRVTCIVNQYCTPLAMSHLNRSSMSLRTSISCAEQEMAMKAGLLPARHVVRPALLLSPTKHLEHVRGLRLLCSKFMHEYSLSTEVILIPSSEFVYPFLQPLTDQH